MIRINQARWLHYFPILQNKFLDITNAEWLRRVQRRQRWQRKKRELKSERNTIKARHYFNYSLPSVQCWRCWVLAGSFFHFLIILCSLFYWFVCFAFHEKTQNKCEIQTSFPFHSSCFFCAMQKKTERKKSWIKKQGTAKHQKGRRATRKFHYDLIF